MNRTFRTGFLWLGLISAAGPLRAETELQADDWISRQLPTFD